MYWKHESKIHYWDNAVSKSFFVGSKAPIPVTIKRSAPALLIIGTQVAIELPSENLANVLLALRDRRLLYAST